MAWKEGKKAAAETSPFTSQPSSLYNEQFYIPASKLLTSLCFAQLTDLDNYSTLQSWLAVASCLASGRLEGGKRERLLFMGSPKLEGSRGRRLSQPRDVISARMQGHECRGISWGAEALLPASLSTVRTQQNVE